MTSAWLELLQYLREALPRIFVRGEVFFVAGDDESALSGFSIGQSGKQLRTLRDHGSVQAAAVAHLNNAVAEEIGDEGCGDNDESHRREKQAQIAHGAAIGGVGCDSSVFLRTHREFGIASG